MAKKVRKVLVVFARSLFVFIGAITGYEIAFVLISNKMWPWENVPHVIILYLLSVILFSLIGYMVTPLIVRVLGFIGLYLEKSMEGISWRDISVAIFGLVAGLFVANLAALPFTNLPGVGSYIAITLNIFLGYLGVRLFLSHKDEIASMWTSIGGLKSRFGKPKKEKYFHEELLETSQEGPSPKILDTSVIIDGRILDIAATGFVEGVFILPKFVLNELQSIADSTDPLRRTKGRRGLDVIKELQRVRNVSVHIVGKSVNDLGVDSVDAGIVALAKDMGAKIVTTDYNLNKIAQIQGVEVLNVNELANALKPILLPGENVIVDLIREGKEPKQGVGYLDDGTMLVVEDGERYIGSRVEVTITSMLQTPAGRMAFGRVKREVKP